MKRMMKFMATMAFGAGLAMLMDPVRGKARRAQLRDQTAAKMRDAKREVEQRARYESGRVKGAAHELMHDDQAPTTDHDLLQKVKSEALGPAGAANLEIDVNNGTVTLTGDITDDDLLRRVRSVSGVEDVRVRAGKNS